MCRWVSVGFYRETTSNGRGKGTKGKEKKGVGCLVGCMVGPWGKGVINESL